jgi:hypothetical protein
MHVTQEVKEDGTISGINKGSLGSYLHAASCVR